MDAPTIVVILIKCTPIATQLTPPTKALGNVVLHIQHKNTTHMCIEATMDEIVLCLGLSELISEYHMRGSAKNKSHHTHQRNEAGSGRCTTHTCRSFMHVEKSPSRS